MKVFSKCKDGGPDSPVDGYFLIEIKSLFSIVLLKFNKGKRDVYHNHAFHALTWFLKGDMIEHIWGKEDRIYHKSFLPKITLRDEVHLVEAIEDSWCITLRGPWSKTWNEVDAKGNTTTLTHGRIVVDDE
jgi:quercetin dioxygenase-like cupin family protein